MRENGGHRLQLWELTIIGLSFVIFGFCAYAQEPITVTAVPYVTSDPSIPHPGYNGHRTTFKATVRGATGVYYRWDIDGNGTWDLCMGRSPANHLGNWYLSSSCDLECINILPYVDPELAPSRVFVATVQVTTSVGPDGLPTSRSFFATYPVVVHADVPAPADASQASPQQLAVMRAVASDDALWFLHKQLKTDGTYGNSQIKGYIESLSGSHGNIAATALFALAMEENGHTGAYPPGAYQPNESPIPPDFLINNDVRYLHDPYAEDVIRALNYLLANMNAYVIPSNFEGDDGTIPIPGTNDGIGFAIFESLFQDSAPDANSLPLAALAQSGLQGTISQVGNGSVAGKSMEFIVQQCVDWAAAAQIYYGEPQMIGGWSWTPGYETLNQALSYQTAGWIYALAKAESAMGPSGVHVDQGVKDRLANMLVRNQHADGGARYSNSGGWPTYSLFEPVGMMMLGCRWLGWDLWPPDDQSSAGYASIDLPRGLARQTYDKYLNYALLRWEASGGFDQPYSYDHVLWSDGYYNGVYFDYLRPDAPSNLWTYSLFALKEAAACGRQIQYFGNHDWIKEFSVSLVKGQRNDPVTNGLYVDAGATPGQSSISIASMSGQNVTTGYALLTMSMNGTAAIQAWNDAYTADLNTVLTVPAPGVLANDSYSHDNCLSIILNNEPDHGLVRLYADGSFSYQPAAGYHGSDVFTYSFSDGVNISNVATVSLTITPPMGAAVLLMDIQPIQFFDGTPKTVTVTTVPAGLSGVTVTYNGSLDPPTALGEYTVIATLDNPDYAASPAIGTFQIVDPENPVYWTHAPVAVAGGPYAISERSELALDARGSYDPDGGFGDRLVSYHWDLNGDGFFTDLEVADPTATLSWTRIVELLHPQIGRVYALALKVMDSTGLSSEVSEATFEVISRANNAPGLDPIGSKNVTEGELLRFTVNATDPDGDAVTYSAGDLPTGATLDINSGAFSWIPDYTQAGNYSVVFTATDNGTPPMSASETITITVGNVNRPPVLEPIGNRTVNEGQILTISIKATDPDGDSLTYSASNLPLGASFEPRAQTFTWTPKYDQAGNYVSVLFMVTDNGLPPTSASEAITITVGNINHPPILASIGDRTGTEGQLLEFTITATDPDEDGLAYSASDLPLGATFDPITQKFSWTPGFDQAGNYTVEFTVVDNGSPLEVDSEIVTITIGNVNRAPVFEAVGTQQILENQILQFYVMATDYDGDPVSYSTGPLPGGASFDPAARSFSWEPDGTEAGTYVVTFYATDSGSPAMQGRLDVAIIVGEVLSPSQLADQIIQAALELNLIKSVENSYMANLKKVSGFVEEGKITPAINQLEAFINKVRTDIVKGHLNAAAGNNLINLATNLINTIKS
jgi:MBG domain/Putative Ig domain/Bacterial Ig domain